MQSNMMRAAAKGAGITIVALVGGIFVGALLGNALFDFLSGHTFANPNPLYVLPAAVVAFAGLIGGAALWGVWMGRMAHATDTRRMALAGALGFAPITLVLELLLQVLEPIAVEQLGSVFPVHRLFTFFFVPIAFLISSISAWAIGRGLRDAVLARRLFWRVGISAAIAFLCMNLLLEASGRVVGAPGAGERATMLTTLFAGDIAAALVGGAVMGVTLSEQWKQSALSAWV